jgi:hypothetical protein
MLQAADLRGTKLDETPLYPSETLSPSDDLFPGPIFPDARIQNTGLEGAKYDSKTQWPQHPTPEDTGAIKVEKRGWKIWKQPNYFQNFLLRIRSHRIIFNRFNPQRGRANRRVADVTTEDEEAV